MDKKKIFMNQYGRYSLRKIIFL